MGCVFPKPVPTDDDTNSNFFKVINIDQDGNDHLPGDIEVTAEYLVLHQKKKQEISWPIRTLRRYGFESNIFSFEAGRRCPTGEGIFAFKCDQAEQLFRLLQANIQRSCNTSNLMHSDNQHNNYLEPRAVSVRHYRLESVGSSSSCPHTPVSPPQPSSSVYNFDEKDTSKMKDKKNSDRKTSLVTIPKNSNANSPLYINVPTGLDNDDEAGTSQNAYICLMEKNGKHYPSPLTLSSPNDDADQGEQSPKNIQYITLELNNKPSSPVVKTPTQDNGLPMGYTTIDFQRTWALFQSTKPNIENDIGCTRRTRHNSTLFGVYR